MIIFESFGVWNTFCLLFEAVVMMDWEDSFLGLLPSDLRFWVPSLLGYTTLELVEVAFERWSKLMSEAFLSGVLLV